MPNSNEMFFLYLEEAIFYATHFSHSGNLAMSQSLSFRRKTIHNTAIH